MLLQSIIAALGRPEVPNLVALAFDRAGQRAFMKGEVPYEAQAGPARTFSKKCCSHRDNPLTDRIITSERAVYQGVYGYNRPMAQIDSVAEVLRCPILLWCVLTT